MTAAITPDDLLQQLARVEDKLKRLQQSIVPNTSARVYNSANLSTADSTLTALTFNSERFDNGDLHSTVANTGRLTVPITGLYLIGGNVEWAAHATGLRELNIRLNGTTYIETDSRLSAGAFRSTFQAVSTLYRLAATDYVELVGQQASGGALNVLASASYSPEFWAILQAI